MFRVPVDTETPTFDNTVKVSFWRWLFSSKAERHGWTDRRNRAAWLAREDQQARIKGFVDRKLEAKGADILNKIPDRVASGDMSPQQAANRERQVKGMIT